MGVLRGRKQNEFLPGTLDLLILQTLSRGAMHGYGVARWIEAGLGGWVRAEPA